MADEPAVLSTLGTELQRTSENTFTTIGSHEHDNRLAVESELQLAILWTMYILIVVGNGLVLLALFSVRHKKSRLNFFVKHLAIADVCVGLLNVLPEIIHRYRGAFYAGMFLCKIKSYGQAFVIYASIYQMVALSLDRFFAIVFPMDFMASRKRSTFMAAGAWILPGMLATPSLAIFVTAELHGQPQCAPIALLEDKLKYQLYSLYIVSITFLVPLMILCVCYGTMISVIWRRGKAMAPPVKSDKNANSGGVKYTGLQKKAKQDENNFKHRSSSRGLIPRAKIKTVKMTICIVIAYILCWLPTSLYFTLEAFKVVKPSADPQHAIYWVSVIMQNLVYLNSATNPFIYGFFSSNICKELRRYYIIRQLLKWMPCCKVTEPGYGRSTAGTVMTEFHSHTAAISDNHRFNHNASSNDEKSVRETSHI
ncbi:cardioacceleratory peptide receptor-like [Apostichopus japonicus]|uniref:Neuropeptide receptor n=1 Tax=Stichopus japonicus TaxID=307972 RepID=A0A385HCX2_STIJA|nr:neuropeptide receptor [Apostichopus japonicus]